MLLRVNILLLISLLVIISRRRVNRAKFVPLRLSDDGVIFLGSFVPTAVDDVYGFEALIRLVVVQSLDSVVIGGVDVWLAPDIRQTVAIFPVINALRDILKLPHLEQRSSLDWRRRQLFCHFILQVSQVHPMPLHYLL